MNGRTVPGHAACRIAVDSNGAPSLLIATSSEDGPQLPLRYEMAHLRIQYGASREILHANGVHESGAFTIIGLLDADRDLTEYFLRVLDGLVGAMPLHPTVGDVTRCVDRLIELFSVLARPALGAVQGLWAELLLLANATDPIALGKAWHQSPYDLHDFSTGPMRIEVKCAAGRYRSHHFSLAQLSNPPTTRLIIASLLTESSGGGTQVGQLIEEVRFRLADDPDLRNRFELIVADTLGSSWRSAMAVAYDRERAESTLEFYDAAEVPTVSRILPPEVSDVRFTVELDGLSALNRTEVASCGGIFKAVLPTRI